MNSHSTRGSFSISSTAASKIGLPLALRLSRVMPMRNLLPPMSVRSVLTGGRGAEAPRPRLGPLRELRQRLSSRARFALLSALERGGVTLDDKHVLARGKGGALDRRLARPRLGDGRGDGRGRRHRGAQRTA